MKIGRISALAVMIGTNIGAARAQAPAVPDEHIPYIINAARLTGVDPALVAAVAAVESHFKTNNFRLESALRPVEWNKIPQPDGSLKGRVEPDGSMGPMQVLRSNLVWLGINNDAAANNLGANYRAGAAILRANLETCGHIWGAATKYNGGSCRGITTPGYAARVNAYYYAYRPLFRELNASRCVVSASHVEGWYQELLGRSSGAEEITGRLGGDCEAIRQEIADSAEAQLRKGGACVVRVQHVLDWYAVHLGRVPESWGSIAGRLDRDCDEVRGDILGSVEARMLALAFER